MLGETRLGVAVTFGDVGSSGVCEVVGVEGPDLAPSDSLFAATGDLASLCGDAAFSAGGGNNGTW